MTKLKTIANLKNLIKIQIINIFRTISMSSENIQYPYFKQYIVQLARKDR